MKPNVLKLLIIDDSPEDADLIKYEIERSAWTVDSHRVQSRNELEQALGENEYHAIICDHKMPGFSSLDALAIVKNHKLDIPFLIVSGVIGEESAVEAMRNGAHDYLMKHNLLRLVPALEREIREAQLRSENAVKENQLKESELRFRTLAEVVPILIWESDINERITYINPQWKSWWSANQVNLSQGLDWPVLVHPDDWPRVKTLMRSAASTFSNFTVEFRLRRKSGAQVRGEWRHILCTAAPRTDEEEKFIGFIGSFTDMTEQIRAKWSAESANRSKSAFLANMSHEFRTPLGAILGFADLLRDEDVNPEDRKHFLDIIIRNGTSLLRTIGEILDLSKLEAGSMETEVSEFRIRDLIEEVTSKVSAQVRRNNIEMKVEVEPGVREYVCSDRNRLGLVLHNVLDNALKFTLEGQVTLRVERMKEARSDKSLIQFAVEDTGLGIAKENSGKIFDAFTQVDASSTRSFGGTGLGLAVARQVARNLGGDVVIDQAFKGVGSRFVITVSDQQNLSVPNGVLEDVSDVVAPNESTLAELQLKRGASEDQSAKKPVKSLILSSSLSGIHVLLIEDGVDNQRLLSRWLERHGAEVEVACNGEEGVEKAINGHHEVILMDIQMPKVDGYEATKQLRENGYEAPIIALTAHAIKGAHENWREAGFDQFLTKPISQKDLVQIVSEFASDVH